MHYEDLYFALTVRTSSEESVSGAIWGVENMMDSSGAYNNWISFADFLLPDPAAIEDDEGNSNDDKFPNELPLDFPVIKEFILPPLAETSVTLSCLRLAASK